MDPKSFLESYLSDIQLLSKKLGMQVEVVFGSPHAHIAVREVPVDG
jgi:hypothetical protein